MAGAFAAVAAAAVVLGQGHADYGVRMVDGAVRSQIKDGTSGSAVWREPADVRVRLTASARATVPAGSAYAFLGPAGARTWLIPQTQQADVVWLGWNTEELGADVASGPVAWSLDAVEGPGAVAVFQADAFGRPAVLFSSGDGLPDTVQVPLGVHAHGTWAFAAPGVYALTFTHRVPTAGGVQADTERLVVEVVDEAAPALTPPAPPAGGPGAAGGGGGAGGGAPGGGAATTSPAAAPIAIVARTARLSRGGAVPVRLRCRAARACRGTVVLRTASRIRHGGERRRVTLGRRTYRVAAGRSATVNVPVARAAVRRTLRARPVTALAATVTRTGGATVRGTLRLTAPRR